MEPRKRQIVKRVKPRWEVDLALGFFGCTRPEEICSSKAIASGMSGKKLYGWHDIDLENGLVTVRVEIAKTGDQRTIRLQPTAVA